MTKHLLKRYRISDRVPVNEIDSEGKLVVGTQVAYNKWVDQLVWWLGQTRKHLDDPKAHAEKVLLSAFNGTKLDGGKWPKCPATFIGRVKQLAGFDLEKGIGSIPSKHEVVSNRRTPDALKPEDLPTVDVVEALRLKEEYIRELQAKYIHLENPIYAPKVEELAEIVIKTKMLSTDFILSRGAKLQELNKIKESLNKQVDELMKFLEISPALIVAKQRETSKSDVGSLVHRMEVYGEDWETFETLDALRELIQTYWQLKAKRPDGSSQLNDWELWHKTRNRPVKFTCRCGEKYELLGGFTPDEIEEALLQAYDIYGFGLQPITNEEKEEPGGIRDGDSKRY